MSTRLEPVSHFFLSDRLKLQFWDWGAENKPTLILVHGGLDHARNWDWVARRLREDYHVYALDLRGHGNSAWAPGAMYSLAEHVLDVSALADAIHDFPVSLIGHSMGGIIATLYAGIYPDRVHKLVSIEGLGWPRTHRLQRPPSERMRDWIENVRMTERREPRSYPNLEAAAARIREANPRLSAEVARNLALHGTNWNADGSLVWKFDNYARNWAPYGYGYDELREIQSHITCPTLVFWGTQSFMPDPEAAGLLEPIRDCRLVRVEHAGHWLHHDRPELFLEETLQFLKDSSG